MSHLDFLSFSDDPINRLPAHQYDKSTELYLTSSNAEQGITKTRSLKPKRTESDKVYQGETVVRGGLKAGETVVTDGQLRLAPGVAVNIKSANSSTNAP